MTQSISIISNNDWSNEPGRKDKVVLLDFEKEKLNFDEYHEYMSQSYQCNSKLRPINQESKIVKLFGIFMTLFALTSQVNVFHAGDLSLRFDSNVKWNFMGLAKGGHKPIKELPIGSRACYFFMRYGFFVMLISTLLQVYYNSRWIALERFLSGCFTQLCPDVKNFSSLDANCQQNLDKTTYADLLNNLLVAEYRAKLLGNAFLNYKYTASSGLIYLIFQVATGYFVIHYMFYYADLYDVGLIRLIFCVKDERRYNVEVIRRIVNEFIHSSCLFAQMNWSKFVVSVSDKNSYRLENYIIRNSILRDKIEQALDYHRETHLQIKKLALDGHFQPLDRTHDELKIALYLYTLNVGLYYGFVFFLMYLILIHLPTNRFMGECLEMDYDLSGIIWLTELTLLLGATGVMVSVVSAHGMTIGFTQTRYVTQMHNIIMQCCKEMVEYRNFLVRRSTIAYNSTSKDPRGSLDGRNSIYNSGSLTMAELDDTRVRHHLLMVLVHYKQFISQFRPVRQVFQLTCILIIAIEPWLDLCILQPGLHSPLERKYLTLAGVVLNISADLMMLPVCRLNSKSVSLHYGVSKLLANAIQLYELRDNLIEDLQRKSLGRQTVMVRSGSKLDTMGDPNHLIWFLRKELDFADQATSRFTIKTCGIPISYDSFMKFHFFAGIIAMQVAFSTNTGWSTILNLL